MSTDRELLELAGKAAGMNVLMEGQTWPDGPVGWFFCQVGDEEPALYDRANGAMTRWAPLYDDGDALRLAVALQLTVCNEHVTCGQASCTRGEYEMFPSVFSGVECDGPVADHVIPEDYVATRRAIVLAAAEIGKAMP